MTFRFYASYYDKTRPTNQCLLKKKKKSISRFLLNIIETVHGLRHIYHIMVLWTSCQPVSDDKLQNNLAIFNFVLN